MAIFWISLYICQSGFGNVPGRLGFRNHNWNRSGLCGIGFGTFGSRIFTLWGLTAVAWTDIIQVVFLVLGGLDYLLALDTVSQGQGVLEGLKSIYKAAPDRFEMILDKGNPEYNNLPGIGVLVGGLWVANLYYWGFNQYIIQRTLAAKSLRESQKEFCSRQDSN